MFGDTIAAISTALGEGAIGIVRISGPEALTILARIFYPARPQDMHRWASQSIHYGHIRDPEKGSIVDEVLVTFMRAPRTYTREDVIEINCHGGILAVQQTLRLALRAGCRLAEPGEFTRRAFLNGRLDLAQAEAVLDVIRAQTETGLQLAHHQLEGALSARIKTLQHTLTGLVAAIEASIDFPEEVPEIDPGYMRQQVESLLATLAGLLSTARQGKIIREGLNTVITGKPNVGKSSLLNALLREKRTIVTEIPGTTRDVIEEVLNLRGIPLRISDTAGIRETEDLVEQLGVARSKEALDRADLILLVLDATTGLTAEDHNLLALLEQSCTATLVLLNKIDIVAPRIVAGIKKELGDWSVIEISAKEETGLEVLADRIEALVQAGQVINRETALVTRVRHQEALVRAQKALQEVIVSLQQKRPEDFLAIDLKAALDALGEITGETVEEDILDRIFSEFCVGK